MMMGERESRCSDEQVGDGQFRRVSRIFRRHHNVLFFDVPLGTLQDLKQQDYKT
jgi:hypothetical protein